jgi:molecular chaperone DnaK (HSP70)
VPLQAVLGVPANANTNQRFMTADAFRRAGFDVLGLLNEPSAASIEFAHRERRSSSSRPRRLLVYDLGGGTFDASLVEFGAESHAVIAAEGISTLGGDDFDEILAGLALQSAGLEDEIAGMTQAEVFRLDDECRIKKEALSPNSRKIPVDLEHVRPGWPDVTVAVSDYYERCLPPLEETIAAVEDLLAAHSADQPVETLYVTGGASELPLVARTLRERFGRRVKRSAYTRSATAIGLAIQADNTGEFRLKERFSRYFGVWREADEGRSVVFDPLFEKGTPLPEAGGAPLVIRRRYQAVHNIGHFRYLECSHRDSDGRPSGDITVWDEIRFPFDPALAESGDGSSAEVNRCGVEGGNEIEEEYSCDAGGAVAVTISNIRAGYERRYRLGRWASGQAAAAGRAGARPRQKPSAR